MNVIKIACVIVASNSSGFLCAGDDSVSTKNTPVSVHIMLPDNRHQTLKMAPSNTVETLENLLKKNLRMTKNYPVNLSVEGTNTTLPKKQLIGSFSKPISLVAAYQERVEAKQPKRYDKRNDRRKR